MLPVDFEALQWLRVIRLTLIARKVPVRETMQYPLSEEGMKAAQRAKPDRRVLYNITPNEMITSEIARASKSALRFLRKRGLSREDREDVLHEAILWCLENRDNYSLTATLEQWFFSAVRDAYKRLKLRQTREG